MRYDTPNANPNPSGDVRRVFQSIAALRATLLAPSPDGLESHLPELEAAIQDLQGVSPDAHLGSGLRRDLRNDLEALAAELRAVSSLIEHGTAFERGWARLLATATSGYGSDGEPGPIQAPGSFSLRI